MTHTDKTTMMRTDGRTVAQISGLLLVTALLGGCGGGSGETETEDMVVLSPTDVAAAQVTTIASGVTITGTLRPYREVEVKAQVPGVVTALSADRGQSVGAGERMARIEAQGITSQAAGARSGVAAAQANVALAQRQMESSRMLFEAGAMSEIDFRTTQAQLEAAQAQLAAAQAQSAGAAEQAQRTYVTSPIAGQVSERSVSQGEAVNPGQTMFRVVNSAFLELEGQVPVDQAVMVREGQQVIFTLNSYPRVEYQGTVDRVAPVADPGTRQVAVVMRLPNEDRALIGGLFATGRVLTETEERVVAIPQTGVRGTEGDNFVWVVEDDVIVRRPVTVGATDTSRGVVAISTGLEAGERVVVAPGQITEGARVQTAAAVPVDAAVEGAR